MLSKVSKFADHKSLLFVEESNVGLIAHDNRYRVIACACSSDRALVPGRWEREMQTELSEQDFGKEMHPVDSLDLIFQETKDRLRQQFQQIETITSRAAFLIGFSTIVLGSLVNIREGMGDLSVIEGGCSTSITFPGRRQLPFPFRRLA